MKKRSAYVTMALAKKERVPTGTQSENPTGPNCGVFIWVSRIIEGVNVMKMANQTECMARKIIVSIVSGILLLVLYLLIFSFSDQDAEQSGSLSLMISEECVEIFNDLSGSGWTEKVMKEWAEYFEHPIRKFAHFTEYACMGILIYTLLRQWMSRTNKLYLITAVWVFLSAAGDEFHQLFVPGRWGSFADVCLDTCGGIFGIFCCVLIEKSYQYFARKRRHLP